MKVGNKNFNLCIYTFFYHQLFWRYIKFSLVFNVTFFGSDFGGSAVLGQEVAILSKRKFETKYFLQEQGPDTRKMTLHS